MMFATHRTPSQTYAEVDLETGVIGANPHKLILMLFEGALAAIARAQHALQSGAIAEKGIAISKAIEIVTNGLKASLDLEQGGELAERLAALYDYIGTRLLYANLKNDMGALTEVAGLLKELKGAWAEIADDPAVVSASQKSA